MAKDLEEYKEMYKYLTYPHTARFTKQEDKTNHITGKGMRLNMPMSDEDMDMQINNSLKKINYG